MRTDNFTPTQQPPMPISTRIKQFFNPATTCYNFSISQPNPSLRLFTLSAPKCAKTRRFLPKPASLKIWKNKAKSHSGTP